MGQTKEIRRVDITHDLNGDGRDDIVIPDVDGFYIAVQQDNPHETKSAFSEPVLVGPAEPFRNAHTIDDERIYGTTGINEMNLPSYLSRVHKMDFNQGGRTDLVFWNEDRFDVHYQTATGTFEQNTVSFSTEVPFDSDGSYSLFFSFSGKNPFALITGMRKKTRRTVLSSIKDMNNDGVADLVTFTTEGRSIMNHRSWYRVYPGYPAPNGIAFNTKAESTIHLKKGAGVFTASGYASHRIQDVNDDGRLDMIVGQVNMGYRKMVRAMVGNSITIDIECYRGVDGGLDFSPDDVRRIRPKIDLFGKRGPYFPAVMLGDISGDGKIDLLTGVSWNRLNVYLGSTGSNLFEKEAKHVQILQPRDEQYISRQHLNRDNKEDLLVY